MAVFGRLF